jgi:hypothetical protein
MSVGILEEKLKISMVILSSKMYPSGLLILPETLYSKYENSEKIKF